MRNVTDMTDAELESEWLACEQYLNDPDENNPERFDQAVDRQRDIEYEQNMRILRDHHAEHGYEE